MNAHLHVGQLRTHPADRINVFRDTSRRIFNDLRLLWKVKVVAVHFDQNSLPCLLLLLD